MDILEEYTSQLDRLIAEQYKRQFFLLICYFSGHK
jgi:hypothetical protein